MKVYNEYVRVKVSILAYTCRHTHALTYIDILTTLTSLDINHLYLRAVLTHDLVDRVIRGGDTLDLSLEEGLFRLIHGREVVFVQTLLDLLVDLDRHVHHHLSHRPVTFTSL